jgi:type I restriction enzyme S subunit
MKTKLSDIATYSLDRIKCDTLTVGNYIGTDNIRQGKSGKDDSQYVPTAGYTTSYKEDDILIANIRPYLKKIWFATNNGGSSADVSTIRVNNDKYLPEFVYYNLFQDQFFDFAMKGAKGSKMPRIDKRQIMEFPIADFDLPTQKSISKTLSLLDKKVELNNKINEKLEKVARIFYDYWFVQFDFPDENNRPYKTAGGAMVWDEKLKRKIPQGWVVKNIIDLTKTIWGQCPAGKNILDKNSGEMPYCSGAGDMRNGWVVDCQATTDNSKREINKDGILVSVAGTIGQISISDEKISLGRATLGLDVLDKNYWAFVLFSMKRFSARLNQISVGAVQKIINTDSLKDINVAIPVDEKFDDFYQTLNCSLRQIINNSKQNQGLVKFRDWLLPMLMNGQIEVH